MPAISRSDHYRDGDSPGVMTRNLKADDDLKDKVGKSI